MAQSWEGRTEGAWLRRLLVGEMVQLERIELRVVDVRVAAHRDGANKPAETIRDTAASWSERRTPTRGHKNAGNALMMAFARRRVRSVRRHRERRSGPELRC
jgi:hypothetical protein